jgi:23S rRNA C2498 (ribose-2'-O)-methylase RlmM
MATSFGQSRTALSNPFGFYRFADVPAGEVYIFTIRHKFYIFAPQVLTVTEEIENLNFAAQP